MLVAETYDINKQIRLLVESGWYQEAGVIAQVSHECGAICVTSLGEHTQSLEGKPSGTNAGHRLFGIDSNSLSASVFSTLQFTRLTDHEDMKKAFKQAVNRIEVETSSQCNRRCHYCPVSELPDRRKKNDFMDFDVYLKLLSDLREIDFAEDFVLVGMNEFFMHEENFRYLEPIRRHLPRARIWIYSNGDYVDCQSLGRAEEMGLDRLVVTFHPAPNKPFKAEDVLDRASKFSARVGVNLYLDIYKNDERLHFIGQKGRTAIAAGLVNWGSVGHNWGGTVETRREAAPDNVPCNAPVRSFTVCRTGDIAICGAVPRERTPLTEEHGAIIGNLRDFPSVFHAYAGDALLWWRQHAFSTTEIPELCRTCSARSAMHNSSNVQMANLVETNCAKIARRARESQAA
jgi:MoaA/NifB/PqqE/SkfB family radical SAM enzyme